MLQFINLYVNREKKVRLYKSCKIEHKRYENMIFNGESSTMQFVLLQSSMVKVQELQQIDDSLN